MFFGFFQNVIGRLAQKQDAFLLSETTSSADLQDDSKPAKSGKSKGRHKENAKLFLPFVLARKNGWGQLRRISGHRNQCPPPSPIVECILSDCQKCCLDAGGLSSARCCHSIFMLWFFHVFSIYLRTSFTGKG